jgi:hypothetical protein
MASPTSSPRRTPRDHIRFVRRTLWRGVRSIYYWPTQLIRHGVELSRHGRDDWFRITAPWIINRPYPLALTSITASSPGERGQNKPPAKWFRFQHRFTFEDEHVRFNIEAAKGRGRVKDLALIFFMGLGDYFFTTPLINALKVSHPELTITAYVSRNGGSVNSPMLADVIHNDPNINAVRMYDGKQTRRYKNYDYRDALAQIPEGHLAVPVLYEHLPSTVHRVVSLYETFGLEVPHTIPSPIIHLPALPPPHVSALFKKIKAECSANELQGVVFLQVDARSSNYSYPHTPLLAQGLHDRGFYVLSASKIDTPPPHSHVIDFKEFAIMDSVYLLKLLRDAFPRMYVLSVASVFWSVSAGLNIPNLGMQHFPDDAMHAYWYKNIAVVTNRDYPRLPLSAKHLAGPQDYETNSSGLAVFKPDFVLKCFDKLTSGA